jgi:hypothetical protein
LAKFNNDYLNARASPLTVGNNTKDLPEFTGTRATAPLQSSVQTKLRTCEMVSAVLRSFTLPTFAVAVAWALFVAGGSAQGQASTGTYGGATSLGGHDWSSFEAVPVPSAREANQFELSFRGGFATDYMYRGTTLSDHKPAVGAAVEATFGQLYAAAAVASVKVPTQPSAEVTMSGGVRRTIGNIDFDLSV